MYNPAVSHFINNIALGNQSENSRIHPIALQNSELIEKTIGDLNRIVILIPNKYYAAYWASVLSIFSRIKRKFNDESNIGKYELGQKISINDRAIARFLSFNEDENLVVETNDATITIRNRFDGSIKAIKTKKPLSKTNKVLIALSKESAQVNPIDRILGIYSLGDTSFYKDKTYLISKGVTSRKFFDTRQLNGQLLDNIINVGSIAIDSTVRTFGSGQTAEFNFLISSDYLNFFTYYENANHWDEDNLIVDGVSHIKRHIGNFIHMIEQDWLPVTVFADYTEIEDLDILKDFNFTYWHWTGKLLDNFQPSANNHPYFKSFSQSIEKNKNIELKDIACSSVLLTDIVNNLNKMERKIPEDNTFLKSEFSKLFGIVMSFSRMVAPPREQHLNEFGEKLNEVHENIKKESIFIKKDVMELIDISIECLRDIIADPEKFLENKINNIKKEINHEDLKSCYLLVQKPEEIEVTEEYWDGLLDDNQKEKIHVISLIDLLNENDFKTYLGPENCLFVCGWMNKSNMHRITLQQFAFSRIRFFFYEFEKQWYGFAIKYWHDQLNKYETSSRVAEMYLLSSSDIQNNLFKKSVEDNRGQTTENIFDFEKKIRSYTNAKYVSEADAIKTKKIEFASDYIMFSTETHKFFVINEDKFEKTNKLVVEDKSRDRILPGDRIVLNYTEVNLLREKADELLVRDNYNDARSMSYLWKEALLEQWNKPGYSSKKLRDELAEHGCDINIVTLRNWLFDESSIGPQEESNLDKIASITDHNELKKQLKQVKAAIKTVRSYHQKAAFAIKKDLVENLSHIFHDSNHEEMYSNDLIQVTLPDYGEILVIKMLDISQNTIEVDPKYANRLIHGDS
jgi:hypothetical protein